MPNEHLVPNDHFHNVLSATIDFLLRFFVCLKVFVYLLAVHNPCTRIIIVQVNADKVIRREKKQQQLNSHSMKDSTLFQQQQQRNTFSPIVSFYSFILFLLFFVLLLLLEQNVQNICNSFARYPVAMLNLFSKIQFPAKMVSFNSLHCNLAIQNTA